MNRRQLPWPAFAFALLTLLSKGDTASLHKLSFRHFGLGSKLPIATRRVRQQSSESGRGERRNGPGWTRTIPAHSYRTTLGSHNATCGYISSRIRTITWIHM
jgi:hypothetical protein